MSYSHLTSEERICLGECRKKGMGIRAIARVLDRAPSTISRELKRNSSRKGYGAYYANCQALGRRRKAKPYSLKMKIEERAYVIEKLQEYWSPEQIANRWRKEHSESRLNASTIYRHIKWGWLPGISRKEHLRKHGKPRINRKKNCQTIHPDRIIPEWPEEIRKRLRIGDWEGDTVYGAPGKGLAVTLVDRKTGLLLGRVIPNREAGTTREAVVESLRGYPVSSLSLDNGSEFAQFHEMEEELKTEVYFAEPHKPWQRGCNENANGLLRFFYPKGSDFTKVTQEEFDRVIALINSWPRKRHNWLSPMELFTVALA